MGLFIFAALVYLFMLAILWFTRTVRVLLDWFLSGADFQTAFAEKFSGWSQDFTQAALYTGVLFALLAVIRLWQKFQDASAKDQD